jgi:ankyrin repeat protein
MRLLLECKANIDAKDKYGWIALYWAALNGHDAMVHKTNVDAGDSYGWTALYLAVLNG